MGSSNGLQQDHQTSIRAWERGTPWLRRSSMRIGLEGKLILCFMVVLTVAMGVTCWVFAHDNHARVSDILGEQARQLASTLAMSIDDSLSAGERAALLATGSDLVKSRNIVFVAFLDAAARPIAIVSRDPDFRADDLLSGGHGVETLMQVRRGSSPALGEFLKVTAPVLRSPLRIRRTDAPATGPAHQRPAGSAASCRLLGYVSVGISQAADEAQIRRANYVVAGLGCIMVMLSLPIAYLLVHRIFQPIRQLVVVTSQIIAGDLDARTAIHRPDVIGDLARSFDEMVMWVKKQRQDLASANQMLAEANRDLEQKVEQRTAQLEMANSRLSAEIAEKEEFLRAVSHDLSAPLRNISGMATMLLGKYRQTLEEEVVHRLERIQKNVEVETDLIGELLELSRIKTRRQKMEPVHVEQVIAELREVFDNDLKSRSIELVVDTPLPVLNAERARIRQIFQNLFDNAIKYMGDRRPTREIHIGCQLRLTEAEFYVRDTGIGIDPEDQEKVFFVFRRGRNAAAQNVSGKGVGLASVKSIVENYSGKIWVSSQVGQGSTFHFTVNGKFVPSAAGASRTTGVVIAGSPSGRLPPGGTAPAAAAAA